VTIRRRVHHRLGGDIGARARPVLNDELLAEPIRKPLTHQARESVSRAAGREADNDSHRSRRIGLRPCDARYGWKRRRARSQMQKSAAWMLARQPAINTTICRSDP